MEGLKDETAGVTEFDRGVDLDRDRTPKLYAAIVAAVAATPWVEFTKPERGGGISYEYLSEEDIVKALRQVLPAHGLAIIPRAMNVVVNDSYNSNNGGRMVNRVIRVRYRVVHQSGEWIEGEALGEGSDRGDKSINKAMTAAYKYFLRELTMLAGGMDPDRTSSDELARAAKGSKRDAPAAQPAAGKPAQPAAKPAAKPAEKKDAQTQKTPAQRHADALAYVAKLTKHDDIRKAYASAKGATVDGGAALFTDEQMKVLARACAARATVLYTHAVGKAADLEAVEDVLKAAEGDKLGDANMASIRKAAEARQAAIVGTDAPADPVPAEDETPPIDF
jgi:hypothetical protein